MHPAKAAILTDALAPLWRRLRLWVEAALQNNNRNQLTRAELSTLRTTIFEIEALLRRLILVAATAITLDFQARWSPDRRTPARQRRPKAATQPTSTTTTQTFRLYTVHWSKTDKTLTTTVAVAESDAPKAHRPHTNSPSDTMTSGPSTCRSAKRAGRPGHHRPHTPKEDPDIPIEDVMRWFAANTPDETLAEAIRRQEQEIIAEQERAGQPRPRPQNPTGKRIERKTAPELVDATALQTRAAFLAELVANPHALIRRAAIAMAKRRELAWRLSLIAAPKARGALAASIGMCAVIIPFHLDFVEVMQRFALSHTEPDTT